MNFIEQIFGIAPDAGNGSLEMLLFLIPITGIVIIMTLYRGTPSCRCALERTLGRPAKFVDGLIKRRLPMATRRSEGASGNHQERPHPEGSGKAVDARRVATARPEW